MIAAIHRQPYKQASFMATPPTAKVIATQDSSSLQIASTSTHTPTKTTTIPTPTTSTTTPAPTTSTTTPTQTTSTTTPAPIITTPHPAVCDETNGWISIGNRCVKAFTATTSWHGAKQACITENAELVVPQNDLDSAQLVAWFAAEHDKSWIGATDEDEDNVWLSSTANSLTYTNWCDGSGPNNPDSTENCARFQRCVWFGVNQCDADYPPCWSDRPCSDLHTYICQKAGLNALAATTSTTNQAPTTSTATPSTSTTTPTPTTSTTTAEPSTSTTTPTPTTSTTTAEPTTTTPAPTTTVLQTTTPAPVVGQWILADRGDSCGTACQGISLQCDLRYQPITTQTSAATIINYFSQAGYTCNNMDPSNAIWPGSQFAFQRTYNLNDCNLPDPAMIHAFDCDHDFNEFSQNLCYCVDPPPLDPTCVDDPNFESQYWDGVTCADFACTEDGCKDTYCNQNWAGMFEGDTLKSPCYWCCAACTPHGVC